MKTNLKKTISILLIGLVIIPPDITRSDSQKIIYPLQEVAKLECRFEKFSDLDSSCKENLKILNTKDYQKYADLDNGYNYYTRRYTVLWGASYKYGWDVGNGGHMGIDIATSEGTPVYAMADGEVIIAQNRLEFGNLVTIKHEINGKKVVSNYAHLSKIDVKVGDKLKSGAKIGEVGSTGNSTGNHLHFQIDISTAKSPAYYNFETCPYGYNKIVNEGLCFKELQTITVDPISFLESNGSILNNITVKEVVVKKSTSKNTTVSSSNSNTSIFEKAVYIGSPYNDIVEVQKIYRNLGYYNGDIDGNYSSVLEDIIRYQLDKKVILTKNDEGAGYFGPKTRAQAKKDYESYLAGNDASNDVVTEVVGNSEVKKISREGMMTREEIEEREIKEFQNKYNIEIQTNDVGNNIGVGFNKKIVLKITDAKGRSFRGNTPYPITFSFDSNLVSVFPEKFYNFTDGVRDITLSGKKIGNTTLYVKMGEKVIKSIDLRVFDNGKTISAKSAVSVAKSKVILGDKNVGVVMLKDDKGARLLNIKYNGEFDLKAEGNAKLCVLSGNIKDIKNILKKDCSDSDYVKSKKITYSDTVGGLVIFNYKVFDQNAKIKLYSFPEKKDLITLNVKSQAPKGLTDTYVYYNEVMEVLQNNIAKNSLNQGYFQEKKSMTEKEAIDWIKNTLVSIKKDTVDRNILSVIDTNITAINKETPSSFNPITRKDYLDKVYKYLVFNKTSQVSITYRDLENEDNKKANTIFDKETTWKDRFGEAYYQPYQHITKGEGAYLISIAMTKTKNLTVSVK